MISRPALPALRAATQLTPPTAVMNVCAQKLSSAPVLPPLRLAQLTRSFSTSVGRRAKNRIFTPVRNPSELESYILSSTSSRRPLITFWTASYCPTCRAVGPQIQKLIESGCGESQDGSNSSVMYAEVEYDSPDVMSGELGMRYMISSLPTLLTFDRGEPVAESRVVDARKLASEAFLRDWIERESRRRGEGDPGAGGGGFFGGLFGK